MKKFIYIPLVAALTLGFTGCKKFLNTKPTDNSPTEYYNSEAKLISVLAGVYEKLGSFESRMYGSNMTVELDGYTDDSWSGNSGTTTGLGAYNFDFTNTVVREVWQECYGGIDRANRLIANINIAPMDSARRQEILGEALFLRGFYYFQLVTRFGAVPMRLEPLNSPNNVDLERTPVADVYAQILKDMTAAEGKVAASYPYPSRVYKTVVQGMLARVCLHMAGYPLKDQSKHAEALSWAKKVKDSNQHALNTTFDTKYSNNPYAQIFINHAQDKYDVKESMWEVEFKGNRTDGYNETGRIGNNFGIEMQNVNFEKDTGFCYGFVKASGLLYKLYGANDTVRRDWAIASYRYTVTNTSCVRTPYASNARYGRFAGKWRRSVETLTPKNKNHTPINFPLLRYADVLLMYAEAENQVNGPTAEAYEAVNMVRRRAFNVSLTTPNVNADVPAGLSKDQFQQFIEDERARELCFEALRRQDLVRWEKFITNVKAMSDDAKMNGQSGIQVLGGVNVEQKHLLYPIPAAEISLNKKITQNPGW